MNRIGINDLDCRLRANDFELLQLAPRYAYKNGKKTDQKVGINATVIVRDAENAIMTVKVERVKKQGDVSISDRPTVKFEEMSVKPYIKNGFIEVSASAESMTVLSE